MDDTNSQKLAFPDPQRGGGGQSFSNQEPRENDPGLTKREYFSIRVMQSLLSDVETQREIQKDPRYNGNNFNEVVAKNSIEFAEALLKELE